MRQLPRVSEYSFTKLHGGGPLAGERRPAAALLHTLHKSRGLLIIAYIEVLLHDCTEGPRARAHATKLYGDSLLSLSLYNHTPMTTTTTTTTTAADAAAAAAATPTATFKYYHHSLVTLSHPLRLRPLLLQTHATRSSSLHQPTETTFTYTEGNFSLLLQFIHSWLHCFFQTYRHFLSKFPPTKGGEGGHVTAEVEGVILLLRKSSLPPEHTSSDTTLIISG